MPVGPDFIPKSGKPPEREKLEMSRFSTPETANFQRQGHNHLPLTNG
jgi:hypothetical protein